MTNCIIKNPIDCPRCGGVGLIEKHGIIRADHDKARREALRLKIQHWIDCEPGTHSALDLLHETLAYLRDTP